MCKEKVEFVVIWRNEYHVFETESVAINFAKYHTKDEENFDTALIIDKHIDAFGDIWIGTVNTIHWVVAECFVLDRIRV